MQSLRITSGDQIAAVKWLLPPDGAKVMFFTAEVEPVSRKGPAGRGMELDSLFLIQHLTSRFSTQVSTQWTAVCFRSRTERSSYDAYLHADWKYFGHLLGWDDWRQDVLGVSQNVNLLHFDHEFHLRRS